MRNAIKVGFGFAFGAWLFNVCKGLVVVAIEERDKKNSDEEKE